MVMKKIISFFAVIVTFVALTSCSEDGPTVVKDEISVGEDHFEISSAGYYYNDAHDGYNFVFTEFKSDLGKEVLEAPSGVAFVLDVPGEFVNGEFDLKEYLTTSGWRFYFNYWRDGKHLMRHYDDSYLKSGKMVISFEDGELDVRIDAVTYDNQTVLLNYNGKPVKSSEYIYKWESELE